MKCEKTFRIRERLKKHQEYVHQVIEEQELAYRVR